MSSADRKKEILQVRPVQQLMLHHDATGSAPSCNVACGCARPFRSGGDVRGESRCAASELVACATSASQERRACEYSHYPCEYSQYPMACAGFSSQERRALLDKQKTIRER